jgi:hypothetical protein
VERFSRGCTSDRSLQKRGRSVAFADASLSALDAHHVWLPSAACLSAIAEHAQQPTSDDATISFADLPAVKHILVDAHGRQHVVLRANGAVLQLVVQGADIAVAPVAITFLVRGVGAIAEAAAQLATLRRILSPARLSSVTGPRWTAAALKLRDALVAVDGRAAGASYREIAVVLHGDAYVERNWKTGLKARMRRHFARGQELCGGRYRELLR